MNGKYLAVMAVAAISISACSTKTPSCSEKDSVDLVTQLMGEHAGKLAESALTFTQIKSEQIVSQIKFDVTNIRTSGHDEATGKYTCDADVVASLPPEAEKVLGNSLATALVFSNGLGSARVNGGKLTESISYTVQLTDDKEHVYVEVPQGGNDVAEAAVALVIRSEVSKAQQKAMSGPAAAQPAVAQGAEAAPPTDAASAEVDPGCPGVDQSTTEGQLECISTKYKAADADLNSTYKQLMSSLAESDKTKLKTEQREWVKSKESKCAEAAKEFEGGTLEQVTKSDCALQQTVERVSYLKAYKK